MKCNIDIFLDPSCVPVRVTINKLDFSQMGKCPASLACTEIAEVRVGEGRMSLSCSFIFSRIAFPVSPIYTQPHSQGIL